MTYDGCRNCGEGILAPHGDELDPTCSNCGAPALVRGGQGRSADETIDSAGIAGLCFLGIGLLALLARVLA